MQKITPFLWFDDKAEEAARFYVSVFKNSKILDVARYDKEGAKVSGRPAGSVMTISFRILGQEFVALNGGPIFKFNESVSFVVNCKTQKEVDYYWETLSRGGDRSAQQCGWLKDRYGLSWQVVPDILEKLLQDKDGRKSQRVMAAMLKMKKIEIEGLKKAYRGQ
ncbi:MAG: VOC family protein [Candidatus Micrarchaeota archaeon]